MKWAVFRERGCLAMIITTLIPLRSATTSTALVFGLAAWGCDDKSAKPNPTDTRAKTAANENSPAKPAETSSPTPPAATPLALEPPAAKPPVEPLPATAKSTPATFVQTQPCEITTKSVDPSANLECFEVRALQVAGHPQRICAPLTAGYRYTYDNKGRVTNDGLYAYEHGEGGKAKLRWIGDGPGSVSKGEFDTVGRKTRGDNASYEFDEHGRLVRSTYGKRFTAVKFAADGTYESSNNYPDSDEECEADLTVVKRNAHEQTTYEEYAGCEINESPRALSYHYDAAGRATKIEVDLQIDGTHDFTIEASYTCHDT